MSEVAQIYRYPVKGLSGNPLEEVDLQVGKGIPFDRAYALAHKEVEFDSKNPQYLSKSNFLMLMRNNNLAQLETTFVDEEERLVIEKDGEILLDVHLRNENDQKKINKFFEDFMDGKTRGGIKIVMAEGHMFADIPDQNLSIINHDSIVDFEEKTGLSANPLRFRGNIYIKGLGAWNEFDLVGKEFQIGGVHLKAIKRTTRCAATCVNPSTAEVDMNIPLKLRKTYGHDDMGIYADVIQKGTVKLGDQVIV